jgi:hypothetical protein
MLAEQHRESLANDGYVVLSGLVPETLVSAARSRGGQPGLSQGLA